MTLTLRTRTRFLTSPPLFNMIPVFIACLLCCLPAKALGVNVACVGDSITYGYLVSSSVSYPTQLQNLFNTRDGAGTYTVSNFGISARTLRHDGDRPYINESIYASSLNSNPDVVVIMLGANDAKVGTNWNVPTKDGASTSIEIYNADYAAFIDSYRILPSAPKILICTLVPVETVGTTTDYGISATVINNEMCPSIRTIITAPADVGLIELNTVFPADNAAYYVSNDRIHPSGTGYALIADQIYNAVRFALAPPATISMELNPATAVRTMSFNSVSNRLYTAEYCSDLVAGDWQALEPAAGGTGEDAANFSNRYYRLWIALP